MIYSRLPQITDPNDKSCALQALTQNPLLKSPGLIKTLISRTYGLIKQADKYHINVGVRLTILSLVEKIEPDQGLALIIMATPRPQELQSIAKDNPHTLPALLTLYLRAGVHVAQNEKTQREQLMPMLESIIKVTPEEYINDLIKEKFLPLQLPRNHAFNDALSPFIAHAIRFVKISDQSNATYTTNSILSRFGSRHRTSYAQCKYFNLNKFTTNQQQIFFPELINAVSESAQRNTMREAYEQMLRKVRELHPPLHQPAITKLHEAILAYPIKTETDVLLRYVLLSDTAATMLNPDIQMPLEMKLSIATSIKTILRDEHPISELQAIDLSAPQKAMERNFKDARNAYLRTYEKALREHETA